MDSEDAWVAVTLDEVQVVSVPVSDQERAREFYLEKLSFELIREDDAMPGIHWLQVAPLGASTSLTLVTWFESMPPGSLQRLGLVCDDLEVRNPDGNRLVLQES